MNGDVSKVGEVGDGRVIVVSVHLVSLAGLGLHGLLVGPEEARLGPAEE